MVSHLQLRQASKHRGTGRLLLHSDDCQLYFPVLHPIHLLAEPILNRRWGAADAGDEAGWRVSVKVNEGGVEGEHEGESCFKTARLGRILLVLCCQETPSCLGRV